LNVPFVSGSARFDAMVIVPCSMATMGRIASGSSDTALLRAADVFLKERRKLILVPRETPWNLIHARNVVTLLEAGATVLPAIPSFTAGPNRSSILSTPLFGAFSIRSACPVRALTGGHSSRIKIENRRPARAVVDRACISTAKTLDTDFAVRGRRPQRSAKGAAESALYRSTLA